MGESQGALDVLPARSRRSRTVKVVRTTRKRLILIALPIWALVPMCTSGSEHGMSEGISQHLPGDVRSCEYTALHPNLLTRVRLGPEDFDRRLTSDDPDLRVMVRNPATIQSVLLVLRQYSELRPRGSHVDVRSCLRLKDRDGSVVAIYIDCFGSIILGEQMYSADTEPVQNVLLATIHAEFKARPSK